RAVARGEVGQRQKGRGATGEPAQQASKPGDEGNEKQVEAEPPVEGDPIASVAVCGLLPKAAVLGAKAGGPHDQADMLAELVERGVQRREARHAVEVAEYDFHRASPPQGNRTVMGRLVA